MMKKYLKKGGIALALIAFTGVVYYFAIARLPEETFTQQQILQHYQYTTSFSDFRIINETARTREFSFRSFDGETVFGQITLPATKQDSYPVMIGVHAMGRSYPRWFNDSLKGRPTVTHVNKITEAALQKGYAVIAIDARYHGKRKVADKSLRKIWNAMHFFGDKSDYQNMIINSVIDQRLVLDWIATQPNLNIDNVTVAGYSMGGQISLLLGAVDKRIGQVVAIVPPFVGNSVASASPSNLASLLHQSRVLMVYGEYDDVATPEQNQHLFDLVPNDDKQLIALPAEHILPASYVGRVTKWIH